MTLEGRYWMVDDAILLPRPARRPPVMVGSNGERILRATLPRVDMWNTWFDGYGNTPEGFARLNDAITATARECGRDPDEIDRTACVLVVLDRASQQRAIEGEVEPLEGDAERIAAGLRDLAEAGADEAVLVLSPITERSIHSVAEVFDILDP